MPSYFKRVMDSPTFSFVSIDERRGKWIEGKGKRKQKEAAIVILPALNPHWKEGYHLELLILFALIWGVLIARGELTPKGINLEVQALIAIKTEFIDPENALASWDGTAVDPCGWYHVTCSNRQSVISMILPNHQLSGTLSPNFGNLKNLEILVLENNNISGKIPPEMGKLSKLASLDLSNNHLGGEIPQSIGNLKSLTYLRLSSNNLIGAFPASLARIHSLDFVDLSFNNLSGSVPHLSATTFNISGNPLLCGSNTNLRCPDGDPSLPASISAKASNGTDSSTKSKRAAIAVGATGFIVLSVCTSVAVILWKRYRKRPVFIDVNEQLDQGTSLGQLKKFSFRDLQVATNNFHAKNILGSGGFGNVYKGFMPDGSLIAVKRLKDRDTRGEVQFQMEVEMISLAVHRNVLRLLGYCVTSTERLLVYPYMPNGSVASRLRDKPVLDWPTRKRIAVGAARGLLYLHEQCDAKIIHRDVKAANILLDEEFEAVVCDFGLAKFLDHKETHVTTAVRGTVGHIAPEYLSTGRSSEKTDVYGFGILLLELITGQRAIDFRRVSNQKGYLLLDWVKKLQEEGRLVELVDVELRQSCNAIELEEMVQLALLCTQFFPTDRPKMLEVVRMLEGDGLSERWEEWKKAVDHCQGAESQSQRYYDLVEDSSLVVEAVELSGPR